MKNTARLRSAPRAAAFVVGLAPLIWLNAAFPPPSWASISDIAMTLALFGPAAACAFGVAYLVHNIRLVWLCSIAAVASFLLLLAAYNSSLESSTAALAFMMVSPAYLVIFVAGFLGEDLYRSRRRMRKTPASH